MNPFILLGVIGAVFTYFKAKEKYQFKEFENALRDEMKNVNAPKDFVDGMIAAIKDGLKDKKSKITREEFIDTFFRVLDDCKAKAQDRCGKFFESSKKELDEFIIAANSMGEDAKGAIGNFFCNLGEKIKGRE